ncbi:AraC family transcriptional regulator [Paenibacillus puerhi]|uniref:AraC family transcriptional regulator n=1 Tax=Paenibacillus puerhi TaxID=2692622 RepID=UPI0013568CBE|nr:AraC family transcriptional regulator [Paenibacillus puerhi]
MQQRLFFERIRFGGTPIVWNYKGISREPIAGFYHWHPCCELLLVHEGSGMVSVNSHTYTLERGRLFFFPPFELHKVHVQIDRDRPYVRTVIHLEPELLANDLQAFPSRRDLFLSLWKSPQGTRCFDLGQEAGRVNDVCLQYEETVMQGGGDRREEISLLLLQLLSSMKAVERQLGDGRQRMMPRRYSERIMAWLDARYADTFVLDQLAEELHLSKYYVSRLFREETGSSMTEYLSARRIRQACHLLETTTLPVELIGAEVGLANTSHFIHSFKRATGLTPLQYRKSGSK